MAVGRCLSLSLGLFGTRFKSPVFVGSLCDVCSVCVAIVFLLLSVRST
jgi:5,10-methenyltetrahydromethanopterin hydrogenase